MAADIAGTGRIVRLRGLSERMACLSAETRIKKPREAVCQAGADSRQVRRTLAQSHKPTPGLSSSRGHSITASADLPPMSLPIFYSELTYNRTTAGIIYLNQVTASHSLGTSLFKCQCSLTGGHREGQTPCRSCPNPVIRCRAWACAIRHSTREDP